MVERDRTPAPGEPGACTAPTDYKGQPAPLPDASWDTSGCNSARASRPPTFHRRRFARRSSPLHVYHPAGVDAPLREVRRVPGRVEWRQSVRIRQPHVGPGRAPESRRGIANFIRFPSNGFTHFLTLFSKFFSSFPHGTCSLSVSCQYSALDGVYHQFWAAFPSNPTHGKRIMSSPTCHTRDCHPLRCAVPSNLGRRDPP